MATNCMNMGVEPPIGTFSIPITHTLENRQYSLYSNMCMMNQQLLQTLMKQGKTKYSVFNHCIS